MKKVFLALGAAALIATSLTSCGNGSSASSEDKALGDSTAIALGQVAGANALSDYLRMKEMRPDLAEKFDKAAFIKGVEAVLNADTTQLSYYQGLQLGLQLVNPIIGINNDANIPVDKNLVIKALKEIYNQDSIENAQLYYAQYQNCMTKVQQIMKDRQDSIRSNTPEAKKNLADGKAYINKMKGQGFSVSESGLAYKIENPGEGDKVTSNSTIVLRYTGKDINGKVFDSNADVKDPSPVRPSQFIPGFKEALSLLGKGGKATVIIPADLAYGLDGSGDKIGPNQTLVFDIEILDLNPAAAK